MSDLALQRSHLRWFDDFFVGERFVLPVRTLTGAVIDAFAEASGDMSPLHQDADYARSRGFPDVMAHGFLLTIQSVAGAGRFQALVEESLIGMLDQSSRFIRPAFAGDKLTIELQVTELEPNTSSGVVTLRSTIHNQRRELVLEGMQRWLLRKRSPV